MNQTILILLPVLLFSIIIHEYAHGYVAEWWGDPTARMLGRLTLNPLPHIDLFGSILVPLVLWVTGSPFLFGWAKPVPVTPDNFRDRKLGDITVSLAGPASNVLLACAFAVALWVFVASTGTLPATVRDVLVGGIFLNFILAVFNLLPIPPLDGSHVVANLLPPSAAHAYRGMGQYGLLIVLLLLFLLPGALGTVFYPARAATTILLEIVQGML